LIFFEVLEVRNFAINVLQNIFSNSFVIQK